jgi:importin-5
MLLSCGKYSTTLTNAMVSASFLQLINCISSESDSSFLASLFKCFTDSLRIIDGPASLTQEFRDGIIEATKRQLQVLADKRKIRAQRQVSDLEDEKEDLALLEEMEDFALEDMGKMLQYFDPNHPLLIAISSVRELGFNQWGDDDDDDDDGEGEGED